VGEKTGIAWTEHTWNPWRGCHKISPGCELCYMFTEQRRYGRDPETPVRTKTWGDPLKWQRQAEAAGRLEMVFTCSWSDFFIREADPWRDEAWAIIRRCPNLIFQVLTKRIERVRSHLPSDWGVSGYPNVWLGVSVEDQEHAVHRIPQLVEIPAAVRFLSCEPLLGPIDLENLETGDGDFLNCLAGGWHDGDDDTGYLCDPVNWVIVGGESGLFSDNPRPCGLNWIGKILSDCTQWGVPCFVKQLGRRPFRGDREPCIVDGDVMFAAPGSLFVLRDRKGADPSEWPEELRVQEFPKVNVPA
jgi:protein gp37